jgi:hypothetical protein
MVSQLRRPPDMVTAVRISNVVLKVLIYQSIQHSKFLDVDKVCLLYAWGLVKLIV